MVSVILVLLLIFPQAEKPNILIIGDSISIGYTPYVQKALEGKAKVVHNLGNAKHTFNGLENLKSWIGDTEWDIIQFNWGLWDLCYRIPGSMERDKVNGNITFRLNEYKENLKMLVEVLKETGAKLVFVTTSYVPENEPGRFLEDAIKYNKAALKIMKNEGVLVNDLYGWTRSIHQEFSHAPNDVHYTKDGYKKLSKKISIYLEELL